MATSSSWPVRPYKPSQPSSPFPYSAAELTPYDASPDTHFYSQPRFVAHIDNNAIATLSRYHDEVLPRKGRILDFCSSWISHYPDRIHEGKQAGELEVLGCGMNADELGRNGALSHWVVGDLNEDPSVKLPDSTAQTGTDVLDVSTCTVSIDYLTKPVEVLRSIREQTTTGGTVHLAISNRCFPTKAVRRWLEISEEKRLEMVGDYLWWSGWRDIEIVTLVGKDEGGGWLRGMMANDPLWVVRAVNKAEDGNAR